MEIKELKSLSAEAAIGETARNLILLTKKGFAIPKSYLITFSSFEELQSANSKVASDLELALTRIIDPKKQYVVCISKDTTDKEILGKQLLQNTLRGFKSIQNKIGELSRIKQKKTKYIQKPYILLSEVPSFRFSGNAFTRNPLNGADEIMLEINAINSNCDEVQFQQLIFQKDKLVSNLPESLLGDLKTLEKIVGEASQIQRVFKSHFFLQWILHGDKVIWITAENLRSLGGLKIYSNKIAKDMLPGIILPLVWSVNTPLLSNSWKRLLTELTGEDRFDINKMTKSFYYRAYFNMGLFGDFFALFGMPRETLEIMMLGEAHKGSRPKMKMNMKLFKYLPRLAFFVLRNITITKKIRVFLASQKRIIDSYKVDALNLDAKETFTAIDKIIKLNEECAYNVIVVRLIRSFHHTVLRSLLKRKGIDKPIGFNIKELREVDPNHSLQNLRRIYDLLTPEVQRGLENGSLSPQQLSQEGFGSAYSRFIESFGHMSSSTVDMSKPQWQENPELVIEMIKSSSLPSLSRVYTPLKLPLSLSGLILRNFYKNFVEYEQYSLRVGFLYSYGYSLFRKYFLHLGQTFHTKGYIANPHDIFYITFEEIQKIVASGESSFNLKLLVEERKKEIMTYSDIELPEVIYGDTPPPPIRKSAIIGRLRGLPTSRGYYEGRARVVVSTEDFGKIRQGDILIVPYSDASWTPLFAKAGAVVSESGGLLSHCSIVAREYGIPAVVAVEKATRIADNALLLVDGFTGEVLIKQ
jgi:pyruvate,water dikinase